SSFANRTTPIGCVYGDALYDQVSMCLKKNGVSAFDTRDTLGRELFHPFTPATHFG
ncbi:unnamed protein product, partial [Ectocarpus sp. 8 AP-2014]